MPKLLDGRTLRDKGIARLKRMMAQSGQKPTLAIIQIGNLDESRVYIEQKRKFAEKIGAGFVHQKFSDDAAEKVLVKAIEKLNQDRSIHGIVVQLPMPVRLNKQKIIDVIITPKDVDGLTAENKKLFESGDPRAVAPATARGVLSLLRFYKIPVAGKKATVIGRSALVGGPIATLLRREGALVTVCHSQTLNAAALSRAADILIVAAGKPRLVTKDYVSAGQTVIDVGINSLEGDAFHATHAKKLEEEIPKRRLVGDVDFESVKDIVGAISPVPGGVGPMTVVSLFENLVSAYQIQHVSGRQDL
ncbi:MAG: bifunctional 5,10-methylenetetrahydrofolate dehydrogenase/5,10-methenyltetrahydrofolate cyclohydrolase [Candidatus Taylorbacteria bacterium]|nr:bifunctional 5,10-methylenetetrahydrofolate dehydrogenase/5,10-methenyltetrahydrofolate cyclohydrolase [Candidatus Taylorbacteria bacterium]